jgi:hypothetical protein
MCADRTIISPQYANSLNGLFDGDAVLDVNQLYASSVIMKSVNTGSNYSLGCYSNVFEINSGSTATTPVVQITDGNGGNQNAYITVPSNNVIRVENLQVGTSNANVTLTCPSQNELEFFGNLACNTISTVTQISSPSVNIEQTGGGGSAMTYNGTAVVIPSALSVSSYAFASTFTGGLYNDAYALQPPRAIPVSGTSAITLLIPWYPTENWTTDTVTVVQSYISDYPINTQSIALAKVGSGQLQITFNTFNSYSQPSNLYSINYIVMNQYT